jgi:hypothetical protein
MNGDLQISVDEWLELRGKRQRRVPQRITIDSNAGMCKWSAHRSGAYFCVHCGGVNVYQMEGAEDFVVCGDCGGTFDVKVRDCEWRRQIGALVKKTLDKTLP